MVVDDHDLARQGLVSILGGAEDVQVVAEAKTGREAIELARRSLPDVVLMDVRMPDMDGLEATRRIKEERPRTAVIIVTMHESPTYLRQAVDAGAAGYLLKDVSKERLVEAVREVASGGSFIETQKLRGVLSQVRADGSAPQNLTRREREILSHLAEGLSNREIAEKLVLSSETVKSHVAAILSKLDLSDRTQAAVYAVRNGLAQPML
ncbi:MAG: response regulator transcription factor [Chloroflexi bacterium]|nr:response regulator transcription factor [Chloroflexota bacterium]